MLYAIENTILNIVKYANLEILLFVQNAINSAITISVRLAKLLDNIRDKIEEYHDYLEQTNDAIKDAFDKLGDIFRNGAPKLGGFLK